MLETSTETRISSVLPYSSNENGELLANTLSTIELLLFIQEMYSHAPGDWYGVCDSMKNHLTVEKHKNMFTEEVCVSLYERLVEIFGKPESDLSVKALTSEMDDSDSKRLSNIMTIARNLINRRIMELGQLLIQKDRCLEVLSETTNKMKITDESITHIRDYVETVGKQRDSLAELSVNPNLVAILRKIEQVPIVAKVEKLLETEKSSMPITSVPSGLDQAEEIVSPIKEPPIDIMAEQTSQITTPSHLHSNLKRQISQESPPSDVVVLGEKTDLVQVDMPKTVAKTMERRTRISERELEKDTLSTPIDERSEDNMQQQQLRLWRKRILILMSDISDHRHAFIFSHPVKEEEAEGYHKVVKRPMDLATLRKRIEEGVITTTSEVERDLNLMFTNAIMYNKNDHEICMIAREMKAAVDLIIQAYKETETDVITEQTGRPVSRQQSAGKCFSWFSRDVEGFQVHSESLLTSRIRSYLITFVENGRF